MTGPRIEYDELESRWRAAAVPRGDRGWIAGLCVRLGAGRHVTPASVTISPQVGVVGDRWLTTGHVDEQVSLIERRVADALVGGDPAGWGRPGDNLIVDLDLGDPSLQPGVRLRCGAVVLELSDQPHTACGKFRARFGEDAYRWCNAYALRHRRLRGVFARVVAGGVIAVGDELVRADVET